MSKNICSMIKKFLFVLALLASLDSRLLQAQVQCGTTANSDLVILLDVSGGSSATLIEQQKASALNLINMLAGVTIKPRIALGTVNTICGNPAVLTPENYTECADPALDHARILVSLSSDYAASIAQLQPGTGVLGQGDSFNGFGGTNIAKALEVADAHLQSVGMPAASHYVVLFSDGDPTFPGYYWPAPFFPYYWPCAGTPDCTAWMGQGYPCANYPANNCCDNSVCPLAEQSGEAAASALEAQGTERITVSFGSSSWGGGQYLASKIASAPNLAFLLPTASQQIFDAIVSQITCNDGLSYTQDVCVAPGQCQFNLIDSDNDGSHDGIDGCPSDPNKIAAGLCGCGVPESPNCAGPTGTPSATPTGSATVTPSGSPTVTATPSPTGTPSVTPSATPSQTPSATGTGGVTPPGGGGNGGGNGGGGGSLTPTATPTVNPSATGGVVGSAACSALDVSGYKLAFNSTNLSQDAQIQRLLRQLRSRVGGCANPAATKRYVRNTRTKSQKLLASSAMQAAALPLSVLNCPAGTVGCQSEPLSFSASQYGSESEQIRVMTHQTIRRISACTANSPDGNSCRGSRDECRRRAQIRKQQIRKDKQLANELHSSNLISSAQIPAQSYSCS